MSPTAPRRPSAARRSSGRKDETDRSVGLVLTALADPTRRQVLAHLGSRTAATATSLAEELPISRQAVLKHLLVLADCDLVRSHRTGREVHFQVRAQPLTETAAWLTGIAAQWDDRLADLKARAESPEQ